MKFSNRIKQFPLYFFEEIDKLKAKYKEDLIDMGVGDPDIPTPDEIIEILIKESKNPIFHRYPPYQGFKFLKEAIKNYYKKRFDVKLKEEEILVLIGSKEGLSHLAFTLIDENTYSLVPDPSYPAYELASKMAGGIIYKMPLKEKNNFLPLLTKIPTSVLEKTRVMYLNYPNNPTGAEANFDFFTEASKLSKKYNFALVNDLCYAEIYEEKEPISLLNVSKRNTIEFNSLSKTFSMTGWRIAFACGDERIIQNLAKFKTVIDNCQFGAIQKAAEYALLNYERINKPLREKYKERRKKLKEALLEIGINFFDSQTTFYIWAKPENYSSYEFSIELIKKKRVLTLPGEGFGKQGKGFIRFSITLSDDKLNEAIKRLKEFYQK
ncbi:MAG: aminotransferase class I/II-fold pyridoxal phosphate-dependent enzyme [Candidatus Hydrothermales bacterium]